MWMTLGNEIVYGFARPNPALKATRKAAAYLVAVGGGMLLVLWIAGAITFWLAGLLALGWVLACVFWVITWALNFRLGAGVLVTPKILAINQWLSRQEYYWREIESVSLTTWKRAGYGDALFGRLFYGNDAGLDFVNIVLRRKLRMSWWAPAVITRGWVIPITGANTIRLYLEDTETFVREAQEHLEPGDDSR